MRAVKHTGVNQVSVVDVPDPEPGPNQAVVDMRISGLCASDLHMVRREAGKMPDVAKGHEPCGVVSAVGDGVENVAVGDRVTLYHYQSCGHCERCREGNWMWCSEIRAFGWHAGGSHADRILTDARNCMPLPDALSFEDGAFMACGAGTTWSALRKIRPCGEDIVEVVGLGPLGLVGVAFCKAFGAEVVAVGRRAARIEAAGKMGADRVIDIDADDDPAATVRTHYPRGVDKAYETSGSAAGQRAMLAALRRGGSAVCVGLGSKEPAINFGRLTSGQYAIHGSFVMNAGEYDNLARFMVRHGIDLRPLVTHRYSIEQAQEAYDMAREGNCAKVVFDWTGG
ncbi:MAG: alcohol dehydrogenase catalytic domain-containing protein [Phycisphaerae bacterium]|nr:alcohol dehydrogenase catalytic domain-containing protein [Phycisphaerae bacterium]